MMQPKDYKLNFVGNAGSGDDLEMLRNFTWEEGTTACMMHAWVWPVYCRLRDLGLNASFDYALRPDAINFIHGEVARYQLTANQISTHFIVGIRADFRPFPYAHVEVVQNKLSESRTAFYMPHLPQPGLRPRDPARTEVANVCFCGQLENLGAKARRLERDMEKLGCRFVFKQVGEWQNMEDVDVLLGFRALSKNGFDTKPPTKLFNAWLAGIPFIGGYDSAYTQVGAPGENYIRVSNHKDLMHEIQRLKNDASYYRKFVDAGESASSSYTASQIAERWVAFLQDEVAPRFVGWQKGHQADRFRSKVKATAFTVWEQVLRNYRRANEWV